YCAGDISTAEAAEIMKTVQEKLGGDLFTFYPGVSYRHCLVVANGTTDLGEMTPPHDISGRVVGEYLSKAETAQPLIDLMKRSVDILKDHPVNKVRIAKGERPVSSIWLWGEGKKPQLEDFKEKNGVSAGVISAVDLLKGIGVCANMEIPDVEGATGYLDTNFTGKADAAKALFDKGVELVYVHVEAPDECGHRGEAENKVKAIEEIDKQILTPLVEYLKEKDDFRILVMPDHPTPLETRTHCSDPVPFMLYDSRKALGGVDTFTEDTAAATGVMIEHGPSVMARLLER
ncbi:MAG: phosphoglycerate mutase, partial [Clostridia bacterium]|nr:phosphoglycerate mutase [Clostridia bacterium]